MGKDWLDVDGKFLFGKYKDKDVGDVAIDDPGYLRWILSSAEDISEEDYDIIDLSLRHKNRRAR